MLTKEELLKGRDKQYPGEYTQEISENLDRLLVVMNQVRDAYGKPMVCTSGWRPAEVNEATPGAAIHSRHMLGIACDIEDLDGSLRSWVLSNLKLMQSLGIYFEDFRWTKGWVHFQLGPPTSGRRVFIPSTTRPRNPETWDGKYDRAFDLAA